MGRKFLIAKVLAVKKYVGYFSFIASSFFSLRKNAWQRNKPTCVIVTNSLGARYTMFLAWLLKEYYVIFLKPTIKNFQNLRIVEDDVNLIDLPFLNIWTRRRRALTTNDIFVSDDWECLSKELSGCKKVFLNFNYFQRPPDAFAIPYGISPFQQINYNPEKLLRLRSATKKIKILFSGAVGKEGYTNSIFKDYFKILNRFEIFTMIEKKIEENPSFKVVRSAVDADKILKEDGVLDFLILENSKFKSTTVPRAKWMELVASAEFFIAAPGVTVPQCHNIIEALSVGTIPICEYGQYMFPNPNDYSAVLQFNNKSYPIGSAVDDALMMPAVQKNLMRSNCIKFYDSFLSHENASKNLFKQINKGSGQVYINAEHGSVQNLKKDRL